MGESVLIFRDLAMIFTVALAVALVFWRMRQPLILGYVLAGLLLSPLTPGPKVHDVHTFEVMAEVGVILLMFSVGIEFSVPELLRVKWVALVGAPVGIALIVGISLAIGALMGWPLVQGAAIGCIISVASTMVLMRLLMDRGETASTAGRVMITLSLVEDLAVIVLTVLLPSMGAASGVQFPEVAWNIGKAFLYLIPAVFLAWKVMPRLMERVERTCNDEISLLLGLTVCLAVAAFTEAIGLSLALGAFVGGMLLGGSEFAHKLAAQSLPIRDAFVALFFASVGMLIDPRTWITHWKLVLVLVALVLVAKFAVWTGIVRLFGYPARTALTVGIGLTQIGEFSFILAQVALHSKVIGADVYNGVLAASLVTILINAALFKLVSGETRTSSAERRAA